MNSGTVFSVVKIVFRQFVNSHPLMEIVSTFSILVIMKKDI